MNQETLKAKQEVVNEVKDLINSSASVAVVEYRGLTVDSFQNLRRSLKEKGAHIGVYKNSLVERAAKEAGKDDLSQLLSGPNAFIFSKDAIEGPKILAKFAKKNDKLVLKGGLVEGQYVDEKGLKAIATLPGREGLISMFLSCLNSPVVCFACAVKAIAEKAN